MNSTLFLSAFLIYISFLIGLSLYVSRRQKSGDDFLLGGRNVPFMLTLGTTVATMVGTGSSMGAVGFAYENGWAGTLYGIGGAVGILLLAVLFASVRNLRFMTMSEELSYYVGANTLVKNTVAILTFMASIGWLGAHIMGGGLYLSWVSGIDVNMAKIIVAAGFGIFVIIGGYTAVVWTDTIQAIVLFIGFMFMAVLSVKFVGGWDALIAAQPPENTSIFAARKIGYLPALSLALVVMVGILATPSFRQRIYSGKNVPAIRKSFVVAGLLYLAFSFIPALIGMSAYSLNQGLEQTSYAFPYLALEILPMWVGITVVIAGLSATMSSASSDAIAGVAILLRDVFEMITKRVPNRENMIVLSRFGLLAIIAIALIMALISSDIIGYITKMIATVMSGLFVCALLGKFWPRYNWQGAMASLLAASITSIIIITNAPWLKTWGNPVIPAVIASIICGVIVCKLTPPSMLTNTQALKKITTARQNMQDI